MKIHDRVIVAHNCEDEGDLMWIGHTGTIQSIEEAYVEVTLDGQGADTFQFGLYQLELCK